MKRKSPEIFDKCKKNGVSYSYVMQIANECNFSMEAAYDFLVARKETKKKIEKAIKRLGVSRHTLANRIYRGWSWEKALNTPLQQIGGRRENSCKHFYDGMPLKTFCEKTGIRYSTVVNRMNVNKETVEQAVIHCIERKKDKKNAMAKKDVPER